MTVPAAPDALLTAPQTSIALEHLFRHSMRVGRLHPLLHVVRRYREESPR